MRNKDLSYILSKNPTVSIKVARGGAEIFILLFNENKNKSNNSRGIGILLTKERQIPHGTLSKGLR